MTDSMSDFVCVLRQQGQNSDSIASQFLNGSAILLTGRCTEEGFAEVARRAWRGAQRQMALLHLLDRCLVAQRTGRGLARPTSEGGSMSRAPKKRRAGKTPSLKSSGGES